MSVRSRTRPTLIRPRPVGRGKYRVPNPERHRLGARRKRTTGNAGSRRRKITPGRRRPPASQLSLPTESAVQGDNPPVRGGPATSRSMRPLLVGKRSAAPTWRPGYDPTEPPDAGSRNRTRNPEFRSVGAIFGYRNSPEHSALFGGSGEPGRDDTLLRSAGVGRPSLPPATDPETAAGGPPRRPPAARWPGLDLAAWTNTRSCCASAAGTRSA